MPPELHRRRRMIVPRRSDSARRSGCSSLHKVCTHRPGRVDVFEARANLKEGGGSKSLVGERGCEISQVSQIII